MPAQRDDGVRQYDDPLQCELATARLSTVELSDGARRLECDPASQEHLIKRLSEGGIVVHV
jgi:Mn-dependent DtxR family transcriptional regulator